MGKSCVYEDCRSSSRTTPEIKFANFVKPSFNLERAKKWVKLVGRLDFEVETISGSTFVCQNHFPSDCLDLNYRTNLDLTPEGI